MLKGPIKFNGSEDYISLIKEGEFKCFIRSQLLPDSHNIALINDMQGMVEMSTFLDKGDILIKAKKRFLIFSKQGRFIDEAEFKETDKGLFKDVVDNALIPKPAAGMKFQRQKTSISP